MVLYFAGNFEVISDIIILSKGDNFYRLSSFFCSIVSFLNIAVEL
jgi:hypothetical protein